jgi:hypothetical protein
MEVLLTYIKRFVLLAVIFVILFPSLTMATNVGGIINSNTTWNLANSPYTITDINDVQIAFGVTLTIEPGVAVNTQYGGIKVFGTLSALGSDNANIQFDNVNIIPGNNNKPSEPFAINIRFSRFNGGMSIGIEN